MTKSEDFSRNICLIPALDFLAMSPVGNYLICQVQGLYYLFVELKPFKVFFMFLKYANPIIVNSHVCTPETL